MCVVSDRVRQERRIWRLLRRGERFCNLAPGASEAPDANCVVADVHVEEVAEEVWRKVWPWRELQWHVYGTLRTNNKL